VFRARPENFGGENPGMRVELNNKIPNSTDVNASTILVDIPPLGKADKVELEHSSDFVSASYEYGKGKGDAGKAYYTDWYKSQDGKWRSIGAATSWDSTKAEGVGDRHQRSVVYVRGPKQLEIEDWADNVRKRGPNRLKAIKYEKNPNLKKPSYSRRDPGRAE